MTLTGEQYWHLKFLVAVSRNAELAARLAHERHQQARADVTEFLVEIGLKADGLYTLDDRTYEATEQPQAPEPPKEA